MIKGKHLEYSLGETSGMKKFLQKKFFKMVITRIKKFKEFLDDGFVKTFLNIAYDDDNMQCLPNKNLIILLLQKRLEHF